VGDISAAARPFGTAVNNLSLTSKVRLAAGGVRVSKVSRFENESGVIKALYSQNQIIPDASIL